MKNCYTELPEGYAQVYRFDAAGKKTGLVMNVVAAFVMITLIVLLIVIGFFAVEGTLTIGGAVWYLVGFVALNVVYIVLHELTHGVVYKLMTKRKLTFGLKLSCAYCGVPDVYVSRKTAIAALCMPLVVFSVLFLAGTVLGALFDPYLYYLFGVTFAVHFGGCVGDIYGLLLFAVRFRSKEVLMKDTGAEQTFYLPENK